MQMLKKSATFPDAAAVKAAEDRLMKAKAFQMLEYALAEKDNIHFISGPGVGKTSLAIWFGETKGLKTVIVHVPTFDVDRAVVAMPDTHEDGSRRLDQVVWTDLLEADIIILDELARGRAATNNMVMELVQEKKLGGHSLKEGVVFVALDNHQGMSGVVSTQDLAQSSRWHTVELTQRDIPWQIALASTFKETDLTEVFDVYNNLEARFPGVLRTLSPRTLEHVIWNILEGHPAVWGLPLMAGPRADLVSEVRNSAGEVTSSKVVTDEVLKLLCGALGRQYMKKIPNPAAVAIKAAVKHGKTLLMQGEPGVGKTAFTMELVGKSGMNHVYWNMPNIRPDRHIIPFPEGSSRLSLWISEQLNPADGKEYVMIADEIWRGSTAVNNSMLELTQGGRIGGHKVPLRTVIALTNPAESAGVRQNVGRPDRAMADRFFMSIDLTPEDIPANDWLLENYGDIASPFIEWHKEDLDDLGRLYISKRTLERMVKAYRYFNEPDAVDSCRPMVKGKYVGVPTHELKARLRNRPIARLTQIVQKEEEYIERLKARAVGGYADQNAHIEVGQALKKAEVTELKKHKEELVRLAAHLDKNQLTSTLFARSGEGRDIVSQLVRQSAALRKTLQ